MQNRRDFLKSSSIIAASALYSPLAIASLKPKEKLGVALVGLGYYSTDLIAPALLKTQFCELKGIVTGSPEKAAAWKLKYGLLDKNIYNYQNFDQIANNPDIDVIYVILPPSMHREFVVRGAATGKHIWCEKPMAPSVADCEAMIAACAKNKVQLSIGYRCQHDPNLQEIKRLAKERPFGKALMVNSAAGYFDGRKNHWKQSKALGGGVMGDMGVYSLQGARMAVGEEPISVVAQAYTNRPEIYHEVEETMMYMLEFPGGARASCQSSFGMNMNHLHITYEKGWARMEPQSGYGNNKGLKSDGQAIAFPLASQQPKQLDEDALAIINNTPLIAPGEEGLRDIKVVEAIYKSVKEGRTIKI